MRKDVHIHRLEEVLLQFTNIPDIIEDVESAKSVIAQISNLLVGNYKVKLNRINIIEYEPYGATISLESYKKVASLIKDQIISIQDSSLTKMDLEIKKLLKAREEDFDFELKLAEMIDGDNLKFPPKTSYYISRFFQDLGFNWTHDGTTKRFWIAERLKECNINEIYTIITKGLFKRKYFLDSKKNIDVAKEEFKNTIEECIRANEVLDLSGLFNLNFNNELLFNKEVSTNDTNLNDLINESKNLYIKGNKQLALEKIWDAFERLKTYYSSNKQKSAEKICNILGSDIKPEYFDNEFKKLTLLGNKYQIRHFETDKLPLQNEITKEYLFFNMLALINFSINKINEVENAQ